MRFRSVPFLIPGRTTQRRRRGRFRVWFLDPHHGRRALGSGRGIAPTGRTWSSGGDSGIEFRSVPFSILESSPGITPGNICTRFVDRISVCSVFCPRIGPGGRVWTALGHPRHEISVCSGSHSGMHCPAPPERGISRLNPKPRGSGGTTRTQRVSGVLFSSSWATRGLAQG
ncbi:hypothetical protein ACLKA6_013733 [Drosophila palustris]